MAVESMGYRKGQLPSQRVWAWRCRWPHMPRLCRSMGSTRRFAPTSCHLSPARSPESACSPYPATLWMHAWSVSPKNRPRPLDSSPRSPMPVRLLPRMFRVLVLARTVIGVEGPPLQMASRSFRVRSMHSTRPRLGRRSTPCSAVIPRSAATPRARRTCIKSRSKSCIARSRRRLRRLPVPQLRRSTRARMSSVAMRLWRLSTGVLSRAHPMSPCFPRCNPLLLPSPPHPFAPLP